VSQVFGLSFHFFPGHWIICAILEMFRVTCLALLLLAVMSGVFCKRESSTATNEQEDTAQQGSEVSAEGNIEIRNHHNRHTHHTNRTNHHGHHSNKVAAKGHSAGVKSPWDAIMPPGTKYEVPPGLQTWMHSPGLVEMGNWSSHPKLTNHTTSSQKQTRLSTKLVVGAVNVKTPAHSLPVSLLHNDPGGPIHTAKVDTEGYPHKHVNQLAIDSVQRDDQAMHRVDTLACVFISAAMAVTLLSFWQMRNLVFHENQNSPDFRDKLKGCALPKGGSPAQEETILPLVPEAKSE